MRNPLKRFRHSYAELNKLITKRAGISLLLFVYIQNYTEEIFMSNILFFFMKLSPRFISIGPLHALRHFHSQPIYLVFFKESYWITP